MRLAADFGARFADLCLDGPGGRRILKQPMQDDPAATLLAGLAHWGVSPASVTEIRIATTRPLNRFLARTPGPVALICTAGFGDVLELGRQDRAALYAPVARSAAPVFLAPRAAIHELGGRIAADGAEVAPLDTAGLDRIAAALRAQAVEAVAVALLFAPVNPAHETAVAARLARALPGVPVSLSHRVDPAPREYERSVATLIDAWLRATARADLADLGPALGAAGFAGALCFGDGRGVVRGAADALADPLACLAGGPAAAARGALAAAAGADAVVLDLGSRSADLTLLQDGAPAIADPGEIAGVPLRREVVDVASLPLGGQSPVALAEGRLRIGAAGDPTLDAHLAAAGRLPGGAAQAPQTEVLAAVARHLAEAAIRFATRRNRDPAEAGLVVCGGTGGLMAAEIAQAAGLSRLRLPHHPAAAGAAGLADAPARQEAALAVALPLDAVDLPALAAGLAAALGEAPERVRLALAPRAEMHPMTLDLGALPGDAGALRQAWHAAYAARYGIAPPGPGFVARATALRDRAPPVAIPAPPATAEAVAGPALVQTGAGAVWVPAGWRLSRDAAGFRLETP